MTNYVESRVTPAEKNTEESGQKLISSANSVVDAAARNPLPIIETAVLLSLDVPPDVASAAVSAANGGKPQDIAAAYAGGRVAGAVGPGGDTIASAASRGAIQGATASALTGKDVAKGAVAGGATGGVTSALTQGYKSLLDQSSSGTGLKASPTTTLDPYSAGEGLKATADTSTPSDPYQVATTTLYKPAGTYAGPELGNTEKMLAGYVAKDIVRQAGLADTSGTRATPAAQPAAQSATSNVALGSQQSPTATTGADVAALDTTSAEGVGSKEGKKGGKYPWGDPEGTTALKQEGRVI